MTTATRSIHLGGFVEVHTTSFGYLHGPPPEGAVITVDVRDVLRDPFHDLAMRELTGFDAAVRERVMSTLGALTLVAALQAAVTALRPTDAMTGQERCRLVRVAIGCAGGRHRSVALANELTARLVAAGIGAEFEHRDIRLPVVAR